MASSTHKQPAPLHQAHVTKSNDDWEEWEDDEPITPIDTAEQVLIQGPFTINKPRRLSSSTKPLTSRVSRQSTVKIQRLKSRQRQKAQNAKAGIKLVTDMTALRRKNHIANQMKDPDPHAGKFVDAAALKALEGEPTSASVGNWNWLKRNKNQSPASATTPHSVAPTLSPEDRPIVIGLSMSAAESSDDAAAFHHGPSAVHSSNGNEPKKSVWSPDTPSTASSFSPGPRPASSIYSQATGQTIARGEVPPVPLVPDTYRKDKNQRLISVDLGSADEDDSTSPHTLFEEDGVASSEHHAKGKTNAITPSSAESTSRGWWDHVVTPFTDKRLTFTTRKQKPESPQDHFPSPDRKLGAISDPEPSPSLFPRPLKIAPPIIRAPTPKRTPSPPMKGEKQFNPFATSTASSSRSSPAFDQESIREKSHLHDAKDLSQDQPPPYSPARRQDSTPVKYKAVFPPGHPFHVQFPPSPGPQSPGLAATMTSQGATALTDMRSPANPLPARPVGAQLPREHAHAAPGTSFPIERERRRNEKEDFIARKIGGLWRGRGCLPESGCFGRTGPEGRKKRRIWLGICAAAFALLILIIVLAVVLTRPGGSSPDMESIWVNLTDYPPMPTGVLTVVGPDNTVSENGCTTPTTMWSCFLPKDDQNSVSPFEGDQPTVIMQIQWDNSTREAWKTPNGDPPKSIERRGLGFTSLATRLSSRSVIGTFDPKPSPPEFEEMFFLGSTTDNITSKDKAGEPTPFYISLLDSVNDTVPSSDLQKRQKSGDSGDTVDSDNENESLRGLLERLLPPELDDDGTPTRARLLPNPVQQPVRLYDRGLDTEHYGFYTYFRRTIFLKSVTRLNETDDGEIPIDEDGGCRKTEAAFMTTWAETRLLVQIWTQTLERNTSSLLEPGAALKTSPDLIRPGTMPYPVTVKLDTHGGDPDKKVVWEWPMDDRQRLDLRNPQLLANDLKFGGKVVNPRGGRSKKTEEFGGFDGGSGGCRCEWANWV
ncbi:glycoprotease family protein [Sarocladium implicatum]|nr:glycoprotease family protein [Sarocladium implicatum]